MRISWKVTVAVILVGAAACTRSSAPQAARGRRVATAPVRASPYDTAPPNLQMAQRLAGCYRLSVGAWSNPAANGGNMPMPTRVHLDTTRTARPFPRFRLVATTPGFEIQRKPSSTPAWSPIGADSLQVLAWSTGTSSVTLFLRRRAAGMLQGTARYFTDAIALDPVTKRWLWEQYPTAPARLESGPCS